MRNSKKRTAILEYLAGSKEHPTASAVFHALSETDPKLSLGTVYRNLNQLVDEGLIIRLTVPGGSDRYDGASLQHSHIICDRCGRICDVPEETTRSLSKDIEAITGYKVFDTGMILHGICSECRDNN